MAQERVIPFALILFIVSAVFLVLRQPSSTSPEGWEKYLDARYQSTPENFEPWINSLVQKFQELTSDPKLKSSMLPFFEGGTIFQHFDEYTEEQRGFLMGGFIGGFLNQMLTRIAQTGEQVNGQSEKIRLWVAPLDANDVFMSHWPNNLEGLGAVTIVPMFYDTHTNILYIESRFPLPPIIFLSCFIHEMHHAYLDVVITKNNPPEHNLNNLEALDFEVMGYQMELNFWFWIGPRFMESWRRHRLDSKPGYALAQILIHGLETRMPLGKKYFQGDVSPMREYVKALEEGGVQTSLSEPVYSPKD